MRLAAILLAAVVLSAGSANAVGTSVHYIYNASNTCAWMTLDTSSPISSSWTNRHGGLLKPGESVKWEISKTTQLKIRAEPRRNADCSGGKIADLDIVEKSPWNHLGSSETSLIGHEGAFRLKWGKP
jgi:hypothetical protein